MNSRREVRVLMTSPPEITDPSLRARARALAQDDNRGASWDEERICCSSYLYDLPYRQLPDPFPGRREDRVAHRRPDRAHRRLADPALLVGARYDVHLDGRHLIDMHHRVVGEVALL